MKPFVTKFTTSAEDLLYFVQDWKNNPNRSSKQLETWPNDKIIENLGGDHPKCIRLLKEDGLDGLAVLKNHKSNALIESIGNNEILVFTCPDICRLALFFHLDMFHALILIIKTQWEGFIYKEIKSLQIEKYKLYENVEEYFHQFADNELETTNLAEILKSLNLYFEFSQNTTYDQELFQTLVHQIVITRSFFFPVQSKEVKVFIEGYVELMELIKSENSEYNDFFHSRNKQWLNLIQDAELSHLRLEELRLKNDAIEREWLLEFGQVYCDLLSYESEYNSLKRQIGFKTENPNFSREQLIEADKEALRQELSEIENIKKDITLNRLVMKASNKTSTTNEPQEEIFKEYKKALRIIWLKTHPDKMIDKHFSPEQLDRLQQYYHEATELGTSERIMNPRNLQRLNQIIDEVDQIYKNMGLNIPLNINVQGKSLKEKTQWLEKQIALLENEISGVNNELYSLSINPTVKQKIDSLKTPEIIESVKKQLTDKKDELKFEIDRLKIQLDNLF
jgi:hypothetical protein